MDKKLTKEVCRARAQAFTECSEHLDHMMWTDDPVEMREAEFCSQMLKREAMKWRCKESSLITRNNPK